MPGRTRSVLLSVEVRAAGRACDCHGNTRHRILKGQPRLAVKNPGPAAGEDGYCGACAQAIIKLAQDKLAALSADLETYQ